MFEKVKTAVKETGEKIAGRGREVRLRHQIAEYAKTNGVSLEIAQKQVLNAHLRQLESDLASPGRIGELRENLRNLRALFNELFSETELRQFDLDANAPGKFRPFIGFSVTPADTSRANNFFQHNFGGKTPDAVIVNDVAGNITIAEHLSARLRGDLLSRTATPDKIGDVISSSPEIGADIGRLLQSDAAIEKRRDKFGRMLDFEASMDKFKTDAKNSFTEMLWKAPVDLLRAMVKTTFAFNTSACLKFLADTAKFMKREVWAAGKLLISLSRLTASSIKTIG